MRFSKKKQIINKVKDDLIDILEATGDAIIGYCRDISKCFASGSNQKLHCAVRDYNNAGACLKILGGELEEVEEFDKKHPLKRAFYATIQACRKLELWWIRHYNKMLDDNDELYNSLYTDVTENMENVMTVLAEYQVLPYRSEATDGFNPNLQECYLLDARYKLEKDKNGETILVSAETGKGVKFLIKSYFCGFATESGYCLAKEVVGFVPLEFSKEQQKVKEKQNN